MKQVIVFAGTTEGRLLSQWLASEGVETLCSVATEYGGGLVEKRAHLTVCQGRLLTEEMEELFVREGRPLVLDVTHPYAVAVSENIRSACERSGCEYLRLIRPSVQTDRENLIFVDSVEEAAAWLSDTEGAILVTTGSKELHKYTVIPNFRERVYARVLSTPEVAAHCAELGFTGRHLICMQGPFSKEMNQAMLAQVGAKYLVTKEAGQAGGFEEKLEAAKEAGAAVVLIGRPAEQQGLSVREGVKLLKERFSAAGDPFGEAAKESAASLRKEDAKKGASSLREGEMQEDGAPRRAYLVGIGMGVPENMTREAERAFEEADCILGSGRMLDAFRGKGKPVFDAYDPVKMTEYVKAHPKYRTIAAALSGDVGFYSGAKRLIAAFEAEGIETELIAGISSVAYFCSRLKMPWEDVKLMSIHGRKENLIAAVRGHFRTFTLLGGRDNVASLCGQLLEYGFADVKLYIGERLHYEDERITEGTPKELRDGQYDGLCVAVIENARFQSGVPSCIPDEDFIRGEAPMTKSEVRSLSVAKLRLSKNSVVWDVGAGTGSVTVEMALQAPEGQVYAIEKKAAAAGLIGENCRKFGTPNVQVIEGTAPEALADLPAPDQVFIGGSSGNLKEILELILRRNPKARVAVNAITVETISEANECFRELPFTDLDITQIQAAKAKKVGPYQMMMGQNPVYIFAAQGKGEV